MTVQRRLDRKARTALWALVLVFLAIVLLAVKSCVGMIEPKTIVAESSSGDDQIVVVGKETVFLQRGTVGSKILQWFNSGANDARAFVMGDQVFARRSDALTPDGTVRLERLVNLMKSNDDLGARLFVTTYEGADAAEKQQLASKRAQRVRTEIVARGIPGARITTAVRPLSTSAARGNGPPTMVIVLSKGAARP